MNTKTTQKLPPVIDVANLMKMKFKPFPTRHRVNWRTLELLVKGPYEYPIDLERCSNPAQLLDYILQVAGKPWCDGPCLVDLIACLENASQKRFKTNLQGAFCPFGHPRSVDWRSGQITPSANIAAA